MLTYAGRSLIYFTFRKPSEREALLGEDLSQRFIQIEVQPVLFRVLPVCVCVCVCVSFIV